MEAPNLPSDGLNFLDSDRVQTWAFSPWQARTVSPPHRSAMREPTQRAETPASARRASCPSACRAPSWAVNIRAGSESTTTITIPRPPRPRSQPLPMLCSRCRSPRLTCAQRGEVCRSNISGHLIDRFGRRTHATLARRRMMPLVTRIHVTPLPSCISCHSSQLA